MDFDDLGIGEPADQIDVVHGEIDDDADIRHPRRERSDPGDGDRKNILALDRPLDRLDRRIEALDMAGHQGDAGAARGGDDGSRPSSMVEAIGFSTRIWMPRAAQSTAMSRCRWVGAAMVTASTPRSIRLSRSAKALRT